MTINVIIAGDRKVAAKFDALPAELHDALLGRIKVMTLELEARVRALAPGRSGKLKSEIVLHIYDDPQRIKGVVTLASDLPRSEYIRAAALEYGAPGRRGRFKVKAYRRTITEAFGRTIPPTRITVGAYSRIADITARLFLRGGIAGMEAEAKVELQAAIDQKAKGASHDARP